MKVKFIPQNVEFEIRPGESVMHVAQDHGLYIKSVCKGVPSCAECRVRVVDGEHNVMQPGPEELSLIGTGHFIDHRRLSCQLKCFGDITVDMTEQLAKQEGLIGGQKKKKLSIKDDRIEDAAIRSSSSGDSGDEGEEPVAGAADEAELDEHEEGDEEEVEAGPAAAGQHPGGSGGGGEPGAPRGGRRRRRRGGRGGRGGGGQGGQGGGNPRGPGGQPGRGPGRK